MGYFSWITSDTKRSICNRASDRETFDVYFLCPDGSKIKEEDYAGYGEFGGKDAYALLARWNAPEKCCGEDEKDRVVGIYLKPDEIKFPLKFVENPDLEYNEVEASPRCPYQGFFYEDEELDKYKENKMKTSKEYARLAFETADNGEVYYFDGEGISLRKVDGVYLLDYVENFDEVDSPVVIESEEQLAEEILHLIPCEECSFENKEFFWGDNAVERDKEDIQWKFLEKLRYPDGHEYKSAWDEFYADIRVNGRTYACTVYCEVATTGYWYYGDTVSVKRVR